MKKILFLLLLLSVAANIFLLRKCILPSPDQGQISTAGTALSTTPEMEKALAIAKLCGCAKNTLSSNSLLEILTDIKIVLDNKSDFYAGQLLTDEDWDTVEIFLYDKKSIVDILSEYNRFLNKLKNQRFIVLRNHDTVARE